jgi:tRNA-binding EMAP/Myf-like protein
MVVFPYSYPNTITLMITVDEFHAVEMKIGTILLAEYIEGADKLLRLEVDFGPKPRVTEVAQEGVAPTEEVTPSLEAVDMPEERDIRQILSGIRAYYEPADLIGKQCPFVVNLEPRKLRGLESHGMILAVGVGPEAVLLHPDKPVPPGSALR